VPSCGVIMVGMGHFTSSFSPAPDAFADPLRKHAMHQTARTAWRASAGHIRTPTSLTTAPAFARIAPAVQLYSSIAVTNPRRARLGPSSRASQQAPPSESSAAPATRPTINAAGASSDTPSNNPATRGGDNSKVNPTPISANAVTTSSFLVTTRCTNNR
jgi:hypothetical protein